MASTEDVDIFSKMTSGKTTLNRRRFPTVSVRETLSPSLGVSLLPTDQNLRSQGCPPVTAQMLPELAMRNQPHLRDLTKVLTPLENQRLLSIAQAEEELLPELEIDNILLTPWNTEDIRTVGEVEITSVEDQGLNTINDPRMGTVTHNGQCAVCHKDNIECPGHYGYINLNTEVVHPLFIRTTIKVLSSVCNSCGGLLLSKERMEELGINNITSPSERLDAIEKHSVKQRCTRQNIEGTQFTGTAQNMKLGQIVKCVPNPIYATAKSKDHNKIIYKGHGKDKNEYERPIKTVLDILRGITAEDAALLGYKEGAHPSDYIMQALLVIPPTIRSPNLRDGMIGSDPIGNIYKDIIKENQKIMLEPTEKGKSAAKTKMTFFISQLIDNSDGKYGRGKTKFKSIKERIQSKKGIIRVSLMGKRVDFTGRTVATPNPSLRFNQVMLPEAWAQFLTNRVMVANHNQKAMIELLRNGRVTHIIPSTGKLKGVRIKVDDRIKKLGVLEPGDIVDRWMQNGDMVIANRQPTIHKQGMMGHEVVLGPGLTAQFPLAVTTPYNLDFDGDEVNFHMVQTIEAQTEVREIMSVTKCIMNAQTNKPMMALIMDALTAVYKLTQPDIVVDTDTWYDSLMIITAQDDLPDLDERLEKFRVRKFSGRALFSALLPRDLFYNKGGVLIRDGVLINGVVDKEIVGNTHGSIIQELAMRYSEERLVEFLTDAPRLLDRWLSDVGFSIGLEDCYPRDERHRKIVAEEVTRAKLLVQQQGVKLDDPLEEERREREIIGYLNMAKDIGGRISKESMKPDNALNVMAASGAKGSALNIAQITGLLAQQFIRGKRMPEAITGGTRALPYFEPNDLDPEARGFIPSSFSAGMTPAQLFFHQAGGREGLMDTAIKTAETGTLHHRILKALENITVWHDGSTRDATGQIIQPTYGEDGFDAGELLFVPFGDTKIPFFINLNQTVGQINAKYGYYPSTDTSS